LGQLAVTYKAMELHQKSMEYFEKSADVCRRLRKILLLAENLEQMLLIMSHYNLSAPERLLEVANEAYEVGIIVFSARKPWKTSTRKNSKPATLESSKVFRISGRESKLRILRHNLRSFKLSKKNRMRRS